MDRDYVHELLIEAEEVEGMLRVLETRMRRLEEQIKAVRDVVHSHRRRESIAKGGMP